MPFEHFFSNVDALNEALAAHITQRLTEAVSKRGEAFLAVSGGSTPKPLFEKLCKRSLPWSKVTVTLADERWVDPASDDSNEKLVRNHLLQDKAEFARLIPLKNSAPTAQQGLGQCRQGLSVVSGPFDLVILGMGDDGHTASLFPGAEALEAGLDLEGDTGPCLVVNPPEAPYQRMSLSLARLLRSREIILHITGNRKRQVYDAALSAADKKAIREKPVRAVLHQHRTLVNVFWAE